MSQFSNRCKKGIEHVGGWVYQKWLLPFHKMSMSGFCSSKFPENTMNPEGNGAILAEYSTRALKNAHTISQLLTSIQIVAYWVEHMSLKGPVLKGCNICPIFPQISCYSLLAFRSLAPFTPCLHPQEHIRSWHARLVRQIQFFEKLLKNM